MGLSVGRRAALNRAINRFEIAVENYAFIGTIPTDTEEALEARFGIENELVRSRNLLESLVERYAA